MICVPGLALGPHATSITTSLKNSFGIPLWVSAVAVAILLFLIISGGIKRIAATATLLVPIMTVLYLVLTILAIGINIVEVPHMIRIIIESAFGIDALFGGLLGSSIIWGVKRSVNSSGSGKGEAVPAASALECDHPSEAGLICSFSVFVDLAVCLCTGLLIMLTSCYNVQEANGNLLYVGEGAAVMKTYAESADAGIGWAQAASNTLLPGGIGGAVIAICLFFFAFTTVMNYYYQGETAIAFLCMRKGKEFRMRCIWVLRLLMPVVFILFAVNSSTAAFQMGEIGNGLLVWFNIFMILLLSNVVIKVHNDYMKQLKEGVVPKFRPEKLQIKNADLWDEINKENTAD